jgi:hypothetical protein
MDNPLQAQRGSGYMSPHHRNYEVVQPITGLIERVGILPEQVQRSSGLSTFDTFGVICHPIIKLASAQS